MTRDGQSRSWTPPVSSGADRLIEALRAFDERAIVLEDVGVRLPTLDEVFLTLNGHRAEDKKGVR